MVIRTKILKPAVVGILAAAVACGGAQAQLLDDNEVLSVNEPDNGLVNADVGDTDVSVLPGSDALSDTGLNGTEAGVDDVGGGVSVMLGGSTGGSAGASTGGAGGGLVGSAGGGSGGSGAGSNPGGDSAIDRLLDMIRSEEWRRVAAMDCAAVVNIVDLDDWLDGPERTQLPGVISSNAMRIGAMQGALDTDPRLQCLIDQANLRPDSVVAVDANGTTVTFLIV